MSDPKLSSYQQELDALWNSAASPTSEPEDLRALWDAAVSEPTAWQKFEQFAKPTESEIARRREEYLPGMQTTGGMAGGLIGSPFGPVGSAFGSMLGGASFKAVEDIYYQFVEPEKASKTALEAAKKVASAGGEELLYDLGGQAVAKVAGKAYHVVRPKVKGGIDELQKLMQKYGGNFTVAERTESFLMQTLDSLTRGSLTGKGIMKNADDINEAALKLWQKDLSNTIASTAKENMPDSVFGDLVKSTLKGGKSAFKSAMGEIYGSFDELVKTNVRERLIAKQISSPILDSSGKPITNTIMEKVIEEVRPVDVRPLKKQAADILADLKRIEKIGIGDFGGDTLNKIFNLDDALRFSDAQSLRSTLLDISRKVADDPAEAKLAGSINKFANKITTAMDDAAKKQGADVFDAYKQIKAEAEKGYSQFNDDFIATLLKDKTSSERVGELLLKDGNESQVKAFKKALTRAARYDKSINPRAVWEQTQQKYLEAMWSKNSRLVGIEVGESLQQLESKAGVIDAAKMLKFLQSPKTNRTFHAVITSEEQRKAIVDLVTAAAITQQKSVAGLSMLMQLSQGGVIVNTMSGAEGAAKKAATLFLPTSVLAKMMTNPTTARLMTSAIKTPITSKQAPVILTKLMAAYENKERENEGEPTIAEDIFNKSLNAVR